MIINIYTDGSSKGNPGPSYSGALIFFQDQNIAISKFIKKQTSNYAELFSIKLAIEYLIANFQEQTKEFSLNFYSDSEYVVNSLNGILKIRFNRNLFRKIFNYYDEFLEINIEHVNRNDLNSYIPDIHSFLNKTPENGELYTQINPIKD